MNAHIPGGVCALLLVSLCGVSAFAQTPDERTLPGQADHTGAPDPVRPSETSMSPREMAETMQMDDTAWFSGVVLDQLEWRDTGAGQPRGAWDGQAWYGGDYDKIWLKTEGADIGGSRVANAARDASVDLLWSRVVSRWWNVQVGARQDFISAAGHTWAALGIEGLAPQWLETEATLYAGSAGRTAARIKAQYELLFTQRLVLQPFLEANLYGRADPSRQVGSGLSDVQASLRLRFEIRRELAPYVGLVWLRHFGSTADRLRASGFDATELELAVGLRAAF